MLQKRLKSRIRKKLEEFNCLRDAPLACVTFSVLTAKAVGIHRQFLGLAEFCLVHESKIPLNEPPYPLVILVDVFSVFIYLYIVWFFYADLLIFSRTLVQ